MADRWIAVPTPFHWSLPWGWWPISRGTVAFSSTDMNWSTAGLGKNSHRVATDSWWSLTSSSRRTSICCSRAKSLHVQSHFFFSEHCIVDCTRGFSLFIQFAQCLWLSNWITSHRFDKEFMSSKIPNAFVLFAHFTHVIDLFNFFTSPTWEDYQMSLASWRHEDLKISCNRVFATTIVTHVFDAVYSYN